MSIEEANRRVIFLKNKQKELIEKVKQNSHLTWKEISKEIGTSELSIRNDMRNEKYSISYSNFQKLCSLGGIQPEHYVRFIKEIRNQNWGRVKGGQIGGKKKKPNRSRIMIKIPEVSNALLEFLGILLGDGSICRTNYCIEISFNKESDKLYVDYVNNLIFSLFRVRPHKVFVKGKKLVKLRINSKNLFQFLKKFDMPIGKQPKTIPAWLLKNDQLLPSILRGLFDTDGSLYLSSRRCIMNFSCYSTFMQKQIHQSLNQLGIPTSLVKNNINASSLWKIKKFLEIVGTSNTKNVIKFLEYTRNKRTIRTDELNRYFELYESVKLPFMGKSSSLV